MHEYLVHYKEHSFLLNISNKDEFIVEALKRMSEKGVNAPSNSKIKIKAFHEKFKTFYEIEEIPNEGRLEIILADRYVHLDYVL